MLGIYLKKVMVWKKIMLRLARGMKRELNKVTPIHKPPGYLYMNGFGVDRDYEKATNWLKEAAWGGDEWARYGIGLIHEEQRQYSQAIRWYLLAALNGYDFGFKRAVYLMVLYPVMSLRA